MLNNFPKSLGITEVHV